MKFRSIPKLSVIILLLSGIFRSHAQDKASLATTTPDSKMLGANTANSGGLGSLYTPNTYDGSANISIPIYSYGNDAGGFGISLGYNTKGVKIDEVASSIGLHFTLLAEGSISRTVRGLPDEVSMSYPDTIWTSAATKYTRFKGRLAGSFDQGAEATDPMVFRDSESDEFTVSAGGLSFSFLIGTGRQIYIRPTRNYKVQLLSNGQDYAIAAQNGIPDPGTLEFLVTDLQGNQYHFRKGDYEQTELFAEMDGNINQSFLTSYTAIRRWVVDKVTLADGKQINYDYYDREGRLAVYKSYSYLNGEPGGREMPELNNTAQVKSISYPNGVTASFIYDDQQLRCDYGNISNSNAGSRTLREVRISSGSNCLRYQFDQSYTVSDGNGNPPAEIAYGSPCVNISGVPSYRSHRLRLNGIRMLSCDGSLSEPLYTFTYNSTRLPPRFSAGQDYFGYYNGKTQVDYNLVFRDPTLTIPYHTPVGHAAFGVDRSEDITKMQAGILTRISNAYGGAIDFAYEAHVTTAVTIPGQPTDTFFFGKQANDGLRLRSVTETDEYHAGNSRVTTYDYYEGQRFFSGGYFNYPFTIENIPNLNQGKGYMTNNFMTPHHLVGGSNHGYSRVVMTARTNGGQLLSRKEVRFTNFSDALTASKYQVTGGGKNFYEFPFTDKQYLREWEMGLPLETKDYDANGFILERIVNEYSFPMDVTTAVAKGVQGTKTVFVMDNTIPAHNKPVGSPGTSLTVSRRPVTDPYTPCSGEARLIKSTSYKYQDDNNYTTDVVSYRYDSLNNLKATTTFTSEGDEVQQINYYNYELEAAVISGGVGILFRPFQGQQRLMGAQRWQRVAAGELPQNGVLLDGYFTGFGLRTSGSPAYTNTFTRNMYQFRSANPVTYSQYLAGAYNTDGQKAYAVNQSKDDIPYFIRTSEVTQFDAKGNPLETYFPEGQQYKAMLWDTLSGQKIAEVGGARYSDIAYSSFETGSPYNTNFIYNQIIGITSNGGVTGQRCFSLWNNFGNMANLLTGTQELQAGREYILSFWQSGTAPGISAGGVSQTLPAQPAATVGSWKQYIIRFTPASSGTRVGFTGAAPNSYLDEVRLCPASAVMQSTTYLPLFGISSETGPNGRFASYSYDGLGRQTLVRDQDGHILNKTQYTVKGAE